MSTSKFKCIATALCDGVDTLTIGKVYDITTTDRLMAFKGDDGKLHRWADYYLKQFEPVATNRKIKGWIFRHVTKCYYLKFGQGYANTKEVAHVYTAREAKQQMDKTPGWGSKDTGTWVMVYE